MTETTEPIDPEHWREHAACRGVSVHLFYPERWDNESIANAIAVCNTCLVKQHCLDEALEKREPGVWGGMSERQRRIMAARNGRRPYLTPITHGTDKGYRMHRRRKDPICGPCREAHRLANQGKKKT